METTKRTDKALTKSQKRKLRRQHFTEELNRNAITNLSDYTLIDNERDLLTRGLSYVPDFNHNSHTLHTNTTQFIQSTYTQYHFRNKPNRQPNPLQRNTNWAPPIPLNPTLTNVTQEIYNLARNTIIQPSNPNSDNPHAQAIHSLTHNPNITIKRADKGGSIVIMNTTDYINKALTHLNDTTVYKQEPIDNTSSHWDTITFYITDKHFRDEISTDLAHYIQPVRPPRTPLFYFLPKIHKHNIPPRPIISGCDSPTDRISKYLTQIFQPIVETQPTYLKDTKHLLQLIDTHPPLSTDTYLVTADVSSLYTNIPHEEGIQAALEAVDTHRHTLPTDTPRNKIIKQFLQFILKGNYFDFLDKHYSQIQGCPMGTKMAPPYANIFMHTFEQPLINSHPHNILLWKRYIDDIFFLWKGTHESLQAFMKRANSTHPTIKLTFEYSKHTAHFLDVTIYKTHNVLHTTIFRKPTDKHLVLHYSSHHPLHLKRNIIYTQALRYKRIISGQKQLEKEITCLKDIFTARGYPPRLITQQVNKALLIPRQTLLLNKNKPIDPSRNTLTFKIPLHPQLTQTKRDILKTWKQTRRDPKLRQLWTKAPRLLNVTGPKLTDLLIRTKQHRPTDHQDKRTRFHKPSKN